VSGVTTIFLMQRDTSSSDRVDQAIDVVPLLFNGGVKLLDFSGWEM
jgi:hypothetical protein